MEIEEGIKTELRSDIDVLMSTPPGQLRRFEPSLLHTPIEDVEMFVVDDLLRMKINGVDEYVGWNQISINDLCDSAVDTAESQKIASVIHQLLLFDCRHSSRP
jgi:hypothetical protein